MFDLITIGDATFDTFIIIDDEDAQCRVNAKTRELCINYADKVCVKGLDQSVGGNATNVAVGAVKLGLKTAIVGSVGDDLNGIAIAHELESAGVDTQFLQLQKDKETRFSVVLNFKSERTILSYHGKRTYTFPKLPKTEWIYFTSLGKGSERMQSSLLKHLKKNPETKLAMNPGSYQMKSSLTSMRTLLPHADILFVNLEEAIALLGKKTSPKACLKGLHKKGVKMVVMTDSARGAFAYDGKEILHMPIYPIEAKAKTGAGDAFASGFLAAQHNKKTLSESLQWGAANSAGVIQKIGAHKGLLTKRSVARTIKTHKKILPKAL